MARINDAAPIGRIDQVRDRIAAILLAELPRQSTLLTLPYLANLVIWKERETPFNLAELPSINLQTASVTYGDKFGSQRSMRITYYLDISTVQKHTESTFADELTVVQGYRILNVIQYILDHPEYRALGIAPNIRHTETREGPRGEATTGDGGKCSILRLEFIVDAHTDISKTDPIDLEGSDTTVTIGTTVNGFFYQQNFNQNG